MKTGELGEIKVNIDQVMLKLQNKVPFSNTREGEL